MEGRWAVGRGGGAAGDEARTPAVEAWWPDDGEGGAWSLAVRILCGMGSRWGVGLHMSTSRCGKFGLGF